MNLFDNPHKKMTTIAITGTKGKTTTSFMIKRILALMLAVCVCISFTACGKKGTSQEASSQEDNKEVG